MKDLSIVIGFKDWGSERILGAVQSLIDATQNVNAEIIVSDYGSESPLESREKLHALGAQYYYFATNGVWSRSRALNAGMQKATGRILATTDADMVFSPNTFRVLVDLIDSDPGQYVLMQCRDLPEGIDHKMIQSGEISFDALERSSVFRPRWGMGGLIAVTRAAYLSTRGLDERMEIYGGEDIDFAKRVQRLGLRQTWLQDPNARMYHVWHPSSRVAADATPEGRVAIANNRDIHLNDRSIARNIESWRYAPESVPPLVSVVISTYNRAKFIGASIESVLAQSFSNWELIIINDGSTDDTNKVISSYTDDRIRYFEQENMGLAAARNRATGLARGRYIAVHDDDDLMLPDRLTNSLRAVEEGYNGTYGGWIDFIHETGKRVFNAGKNLSLESLLFNSGACLHPTLFLEKRFFEAVPYDETLRSGSDYNLAIRMQRAGAMLRHSGKYLIMRRLHEDQITKTDSEIQKASGALSSFVGRSTMLWSDVSAARENRAAIDKAPISGQKDVEPQVIAFLPDGVVRRNAHIQIKPGIDPLKSTIDMLTRATGFEIREISNRFSTSTLRINDLNLSELLSLHADPAIHLKVETIPLVPEAKLTSGDPVTLDDSEIQNIDQTVRTIFTERFNLETGSFVLEIQGGDLTVVSDAFNDVMPTRDSIRLSVTQGKAPTRWISLGVVNQEELTELLYSEKLTNLRSKNISTRVYTVSEKR